MKKTKQNTSLLIGSKNTYKLPVECKYSTSKKTIRQKKAKEVIVHKENRSFVGIQKQFIKSFTPKKPSQNKKKQQRSKSLLFQHRNCEMIGDVPTIENTNRKTLREHFKLKSEKEETKESGCINSIRFEEVREVDLNINNDMYSPYRQKDNLVHSELKKSHLCLQEVMGLKFQGERSTVKIQKEALQIKIASLQQQMQSIRSDEQAKQRQLQQQFNADRSKLVGQIAELRACKLQFKQQKYDLECIISDQREYMQKADQDKNLIIEQLKKEQGRRTELQRDNYEFKLRIRQLEEQLCGFQSNLSEFGKMRVSYESRLQELQFQKKKIKSHACELLDMLHKYQKEEQE